MLVILENKPLSRYTKHAIIEVIPMPELPEVETTLRGLKPHVEGQTVTNLLIRNHHLRWPVPTQLPKLLGNQAIRQLSRRAKYLLWRFNHGTLITHLGMSGYFRVLHCDVKAEKHDHIDLILNSNTCIRYCDPRRFGAFVWTTADPATHTLLQKLGVEPLSPDFNADYLFTYAKRRQCSIKQFIMNHHIVVGVGNIYAAESLFAAKINPKRAANQVGKSRLASLVTEIKRILRKAIKAGGTTLKNFHHADGKPGFFKFHLQVYGQANAPCPHCATPIKQITQAQRSTYYCPKCQR